MDVKKYTMDWLGKPLELEFGKMALQATSSCTVRYGDTVLLIAVTMSKHEVPLDYFPLSVEYQEKYYAAGKIKGSRFIKRETRPSDDATLIARLVDRAIRPLFDDSMRNEIQVVATTLSFDKESPTDVPAMIGAAAALAVSPIPWAGPIAGLRIARKNGQMVFNKVGTEEDPSDMNIYLAGDGEKVIMLEAEGAEITEDEFLAATQEGNKQLKPIIDLINKIQSEIGQEKLPLGDDAAKLLSAEDQEKYFAKKNVLAEARAFVHAQVDDVLSGKNLATKQLRKDTMYAIADALKADLKARDIDENVIKAAVNKTKEFAEEKISEYILQTKQRIDGRGIEEIRKISVETGILPRPHGVGLFSRGETQVLTVLTLGSPGDEQVIDDPEFKGKKRYMHHYNFPGYSVGEVKFFRGASRRDIGHGALAEKALERMIPDKDQFPYTIRLVSEVMGSNGSSSMGSVCGSTLALMDGGVPIKKPVAGIAMGLVSNEKGEYQVLTDLQDLEDAVGGMDFKIAGTKDGITAVQLDTKTHGLSDDIVKQTLSQAKKARLELLAIMLSVIPEPRKEMSPYAPRIEILHVDPDKIRKIIGPGGKQINEIIDATGVNIDIEDDGSVFITSADKDAMVQAVQWIEMLTKEAKVGDVYEGTVTRLMDFGAFVEILPGQEGLVHISEVAHTRTERMDAVLKVGDKVKVKVIEIDDIGRVNLSMKALLPKPEGFGDHDDAPRRPSPRPQRDGQRGGSRGGRPQSRGGRR